MYFSGLKKAIQSLEESHFYDIALIFLAQLGYKDLSIVDGSGDGGRDVTCSRTDLRIQLSVRKDWGNKINEEAEGTNSRGKQHFIYVTNRVIGETERVDYFAKTYKYRGIVDVSIYDLNRVATELSHPGIIREAYARLGISYDAQIKATSKDIAISSLLLFSNDTRDLVDNAIEARIKAKLLDSPGLTEENIALSIQNAIPGEERERSIRKAISRMRTTGEINIQQGKLHLGTETMAQMQAAKDEFELSIKNDLQSISKQFSLAESVAFRAIQLALEIAAKGRELHGDGVQEIELQHLISSSGLARKKNQFYLALSKVNVTRVKQYGNTIDHIFSTNTFDIYRALGRHTEVELILDSSVAMPMLFGLCFGASGSRYGVVSNAMLALCKAHDIRISVPTPYLEEMVFHGIHALEYLAAYDNLPDVAKETLRASGNAYLSHYSHIREVVGTASDPFTLETFLAHFGLRRGASPIRVENKIRSLLEDFGILVVETVRREQNMFEHIKHAKPMDPSKIIEHDALVCTFLRDNSSKAFVFATWDKVLLGIVEGIARIYVDTPARIVDFFALAKGAVYEPEQNFELLTSLIYCDEKKLEAVARKLEQIKTAEQAYKLRDFADHQRASSGDDWALTDKLVDEFFAANPIEDQIPSDGNKNASNS